MLLTANIKQLQCRVMVFYTLCNCVRQIHTERLSYTYLFLSVYSLLSTELTNSPYGWMAGNNAVFALLLEKCNLRPKLTYS